MSKGNLFLGQARGSVGDVTFTHTDGVQIARSRNRSPKNPQSVLQMVTRIVQSSASKAYSLFLPICDHAFQGKAVGTPNQSRFMQLNTAMLRSKLAAVIMTPTEEMAMASGAYNFSFHGEQLPVFNEWIVSAGTLPPVAVEYLSDSLEFAVGPVLSASNPLDITYQDVVNALHAQQGDQLTVLAMANDSNKIGDFGPTIDAFEYARIILEPSSGNMSAPFFTGETAPFSVNLPNERNEGTIQFGWTHSRLNVSRVGTLYGASASGTTRWIMGAAAILSRPVNGTWERSNQSVVYIKDGEDALNWGDFGSAYITYKNKTSSSPLYLNQGGTVAVDTSVGGPLEWLSWQNSGGNNVWTPVSAGRFPCVSVNGTLQVPVKQQAEQPTESAEMQFSSVAADLQSRGLVPAVLLEQASLDAETAIAAVNAWFNPATHFTVGSRP